MTYGLHMDMKKDAGIAIVTYAIFREKADSTPTRRVERFDLSRPGINMDTVRDFVKGKTSSDRVTYVVVEIQNWHAEKLSGHKWTRAKGWVAN